MQTLLIVAMLPMWLIGLVVFYYIIKPISQKHEIQTDFDTSNRINRLRAVWFTLSKPWILVEFWPWLKKDEGEQ